MKVLLLNPPGSKVYIRDYYCSKVSKSDYIYHPTDLLVLSGILSKAHEVSVIDAIAEGMGPGECAARVTQGGYGAVIFLTGAVSWAEDSEFIRRIKSGDGGHGKGRSGDKPLTIGTGDILLEKYGEFLKKNEFLDAIMLDFTTEDILTFLEGDYDKVRNIVFRRGSEVVDNGVLREKSKEFEIPVPRYDLFPNEKYNYPFVLRHPFVTVLTDYGCPFKCSFCVMVALGFKYRSIENVMEELKSARDFGFRDIYFNDQTFGVRRERLEDLCNRMIDERIGMGWVCWSRVDLIDEPLLTLMKRAGCHTILFGVETSNDAVLKENKKGFTSAQVEKTFALCKRLGVRTLGTFILGLPGEDRASCLRTIEFAKKIGADFASFNVLIPRMNTEVRGEAIERGWIDSELELMDQSGSFAVMSSDKMSPEEILALRDLAVKSFYMRPSYIVRRLLNIKTTYELKLLCMNGWGVLRKFFTGKDTTGKDMGAVH